MSSKKKNRSINDIMKFFEKDILTPDFLYNNLRDAERLAFYDALSKHPTKYLRGYAQFSEKQLAMLEWLRITKCKNAQCEYHIS